MADFTLSVYTSLARGLRQLSEMSISSGVTDLRWDANANGFGDLTCGQADDLPWPVVGRLPKPINLPWDAHVEVRYGSRLVYEGRVYDRTLGQGGRYVAFRAQGYQAYLNDHYLDSASTTSVTSGEALEAALPLVAPYLRLGNAEQFIDPGVVHAGGLAEWRYLTLGAMVDQIIKEGNSDGESIDIGVWEGLRLWCRPRVAPDEPDYRIPFDPSYVSWSESKLEMASSVVVEYATNTRTAAATLDGFLDAYGFTRSLYHNGGTLDATQAAAFRDADLTLRSVPQVTALVSLSDGAGLLLPSGVERPAELVRPLEWIEVAGQPMQPIVGITRDATAETLAVEIGQPSPYIPRNTSLLVNGVVARLARGINPISGGKAR